MIFLSILILIVAKALISNNNLSPVLYPRITAIIFIYAGVLSLNTLYIQSIGSGVGIYSGLFHITSISQFIEGFIYFIGSVSLLLIFSNLPKILNKFKANNFNFMSNKIPNFFNTNNYFNFYTLIVIIISAYYTFYDVTMADFIAILISFFTFSLVTSFILNNFKFSKIFIVKILQKILFTFIVLIISIYLLQFFDFQILTEIFCDTTDDDDDSQNSQNNSNEVINIKEEKQGDDDYYSFKIKKEVVENSFSRISDTVKAVASSVAPNIGIAGAAGTVASATVKATAGLPPMQRAAAVGGSAFITAVSTNIGIQVGDSIAKNTNLNSLIKDSPHANPDVNRVPSPDFSIHSVLEPGESLSPLEELLNSLLSLNLLIFFAFLLILYVHFSKYISIYFIKFLTTLINKFMPESIKVWYNKKVVVGVAFSKKFNTIMLTILSIQITLLILGSIYVTAEISNNLDDYVGTYNYLKNIKENIPLFVIINYKILKCRPNCYVRGRE